MVPAPKADVAVKAHVVQHPARLSSKPSPLKSKYFQPPARGSFAADGATTPDGSTSPTLDGKSPETLNGNNHTNGVHQPSSPDRDPGDMGFDDAARPATASSETRASPYLNHSASLRSAGRGDASPRTSGEEQERGKKPTHRHTKSGGHIADISITTVPARKPLRDDVVRSASVDTSTLNALARPDPSRKVSEGGPTLRPIAYSPEPGVEDEEPRASRVEGDDQPERESSPPPAKSKAKDAAAKPSVPPRLPLLYFEQESVAQMDFAYQDPRPASQFSNPQLKLDLNTDEPILKLDFPYDAAASALEDDGRDQATPMPEKTDEAAEEPLRSSPKTSPRLSPAKIDTSVGTESTEEELQQAPEEQDPKTPPIKQEKTGEAGSFYWNSPRSSTEDSGKSAESSEDDAQPVHTPPEEEDQMSTTPKKPATPASGEALVSASALGFGGPSDWEHFGDYDAEEVDDIDLYTSPKTEEPPIRIPNVLNAVVKEVDPEDDDDDEMDVDETDGVPQRPFLDRKILSTIEERQSENLEDIFSDKPIENQHGETIDARAVFDAHPPPPPPRQAFDNRDSDEVQQEDVDTGDIAQRQSGRSSSTETIERISFHVPPPPDSTASETSSNRESRPVSDDPPPNSDIPSMVDLAPKEPVRSPVVDTDVTTPKAVDDSASTADTEPRSETVSQGVKTRHASSVLSPTSDDGKEEIMISLEVPPQIEASKGGNRASQQPQQPKDAIRIGRRSIYPGSVPLDDPYSSLEAWARASLNRYVKVLHEEAQARSNEDKYKIFVNFMHNEQRIRAVFYDQDDESDISDQPVQRPTPRIMPPVDTMIAQPLQTPGSAVRTSKALPALPSEPEPTPVGSPAVEYEEPSHGSGKASLQSLGALRAQEAANGSPPEIALRPETPTNGRLDEAYADSPKTEKFGKDKKQLKEKNSGNLRGAPSLNALRKALDIVTTRKSSLTPKDAQANARASIARASGQPTRGEFNADVKSPHSVASPASAANEGQMDARPEEIIMTVDDATADANQHEGKPYEGDKAANRQSIYQPFSTMLRQSSIRSGTSGAGDRRKSPQAHESLSGSFEGEDGKSPVNSPRPPQATESPSYRYTILEPLLAVVPQESVLRQEPEQLVRLRLGMDAIPDDFSFIHKTVLEWDADAKKAREQYERERHARQGQNEQRIDELFNDHEIGYSDISRLEADFKRAEAAKKAEEDREEVQTFVDSVFDVVWARINYEMDQLTPLYEECTRLVADASAGRGMFEEDTTVKVPIAPAMETLLILYQKLMVRHQKAFEAVLERDRRLKKVEVAPWYALGAVDKVKRIERRFEDAEKKAILEFCRQRDERANLLMDVLDQNTLRGVGANQDYMESMMQAVRAIAEALALGEVVGADDRVSTDEVLKAKTITTALARSSEQIVQTFHVADMLLNAADYEVSVANAKLSAADAAAFRRLRDAKAKEDNKLALDLEHRMGLIRGDTTRTQDEVTKLLMLLQERQGDGGRAAEAIAEEGELDPEREQRLRAALVLEERMKQPETEQ